MVQVHVRYEDTQSVPGRPFTFGVTLDHIHIQSTDYDWKPGKPYLIVSYPKAFLSVGQKIMHKLVSLNHLGVYFNTGDSEHALPLLYKDVPDLQNQMDKLVPVAFLNSDSLDSLCG